MTTGVSLVCVVAGTFIACRADRYPQYRATIETVAGTMLICGFGLLGCVLGPP